MSAAALASRLVAAFSNHEAGLEEYLDGASEQEQQGLVAQLESWVRSKVSVVPLLQVLLHLQPTRLPSARSALRLMQAEAIEGLGLDVVGCQ